MRLTFDQALVMETVIAGETFTVSDGVTQVAGSVFLDGERTVVFRPVSAFESGKSYIVTVTPGIRSTLGRVLPKLYEYIFSVN